MVKKDIEKFGYIQNCSGCTAMAKDYKAKPPHNEACRERIQSKLEENPENLACSTRQFLATQAKVCRVAKCWNPELAKLELMAVPGSLSEAAVEAILRICKSVGKGQEKPWLDKMQKTKDKDGDGDMSTDEE